MATVHQERLSNVFSKSHRAFSQQQREAQIDEDMSAGYSIPAILTAIALFGLLSMIVSVWLAI